MRRILLTTTFLLSISVAASAADVNRVWDLCAKRGTCEHTTLMSRQAMADLQPAILREGLPELAQQRNPDPFHQFTQQPSPPAVQPRSTEGQQPIGNPIVLQAPSEMPQGILGWVLAAIAAIFTGGNLFNGFRAGNIKLGDGQIDPQTKVALLQLARRGVQSPLVDNLLNFPGEDLVEGIITRIIDRRLGTLQGQGGGTTFQGGGTASQVGVGMTRVPTEKLTGLLDGVEALIQRLGQQQTRGVQPVDPSQMPRT